MGFNVAVVGATGNVGREMLEILAERTFPADEVVANGFAEADVAIVKKRVESTHWKRRLPTVAMVSPTAIGESYLRPVDY